MITVVIPFFQRQPGVLGKALRSIANQQPCGHDVGVIVVDDGSPVPAKDEIGPFTNTLNITVIAQPNQGPGAARNTGISKAPVGTAWIAFLDSDDEWSPSHLKNAVEALNSGADAFFGNHLQLGQQVGAFERAGRLDMSKHTATSCSSGTLYHYGGDMIDQILRGNLIGTSTVVYSLGAFPACRFRPEFRTAGEDYLFWMDLAKSGAKFAFSKEIEATYGRGVNIYSGSGWGTEEFAARNYHEFRYRKLSLAAYARNPEQKSFLLASIRTLRTAFAQDFWHRLFHRKRVLRKVLWDQLTLDPLSLLALPQVLLNRLKGPSA